MYWISFPQSEGRWYALSCILVFAHMRVLTWSTQVLLDPSLTKGKSKDWKEMRQELDRAGTLKVNANYQLLLHGHHVSRVSCDVYYTEP